MLRLGVIYTKFKGELLREHTTCRSSAVIMDGSRNFKQIVASKLKYPSMTYEVCFKICMERQKKNWRNDK
jgi:hypothetical protein